MKDIKGVIIPVRTSAWDSVRYSTFHSTDESIYNAVDQSIKNGVYWSTDDPVINIVWDWVWSFINK